MSGKLIASAFNSAGQRIGPLRDRAGAEADHVVARLRQALDDAGELLRAVERNHVAVAARAQRLHQMIAVDAFDRRFAGRIDWRDDHGVGVVEAGARTARTGSCSRV